MSHLYMSATWANIARHPYLTDASISNFTLRRFSMTDTNALPPSRHGDEYPPSRPGLKTFVGVAVVLLIGAGIVFWPAISPFVGL